MVLPCCNTNKTDDRLSSPVQIHWWSVTDTFTTTNRSSTTNDQSTSTMNRSTKTKTRPTKKRITPLQCSTRNQTKPRRSKRAKTVVNHQQSTEEDRQCLGDDLATMCRTKCTSCSQTFQHHRDWVHAKWSMIQGKGVFAKQTIPPNTFLVKYMGTEVTSVRPTQRYVIRLRNKYLDAEGLRGIHKYVNHCCDGNKFTYQRSARLHLWCDEKGIEHISIVTNRQVEKGEEIFVHYGSDYLIQDCCCPNCKVVDNCS